MLSIQAQTLYGTTREGGSGKGGTIIKFIPATNIPVNQDEWNTNKTDKCEFVIRCCLFFENRNWKSSYL